MDIFGERRFRNLIHLTFDFACCDDGSRKRNGKFGA